ncbi:IS701 family transposase [Verminephrobacter aporrectodeae subsp. tuberculatae]|uniref:IS701 family transposase n=2 Tax=Verminephrobacter aporrectodeae TaxID=1110389 RepID=UPI002237A127|nr:IS701 family transposase [Verminephrobacter aporrectodeae]MCW5257529.1 IS701 family transposase [Verminephrobacter aporrectodeae subsp. tuberculatae]
MKDELQEFERYLEHLGGGLGHADRQAGLRGYCIGLMAPLARKSVEPMAAHLAPQATRSRHQSLHHFVAQSSWSDEEMLRRVAQWVVPAMDFEDGGWWIVDDTGFPKQGEHSVGVARQYCGMLGKQDNCQVAVSVSLACQAGSLPTAWQLYLPQQWADDRARREKAGVPEDVLFATKWQIAQAQIEHLVEQGAPKHTVLADAGYGVVTAFREGLTAMGLTYVVGVTGQVTVWPPGHAPLGPRPRSGRGVVATRQRLGDARHERPLCVKEVALGLEPTQWQSIEWREGTNFTLRSRFARVRVHAAHREHLRTEQRAQEWLLIEWPEGHEEPMKYWLSTLAEDITLERMVFEAKMRWRIERDYQDLKQDLGLGHYEGRNWRGFHHHASLAIAAYGFLMAQQLRHPEGGGKKNSARSEEPALPTHYKPRGSPAHAAPRPIVDHNFAAAYRRSLAQDAAALPMLPARKRENSFVTQ